MSDTPNNLSSAAQKALLELDRRVNPGRYRQMEKQRAERRAQLAQDILLSMAPNAIDVLRDQLSQGRVQEAAEAYADLAVRTADALIERLNRKN